MATRTILHTAEELERLPKEERCELVDGVLVPMDLPGFEHGAIALRAGTLLDGHVRPNRLGYVVVEAGFILRRGPDTVRFPDLAFVRADRIPPGRLPRSFPELAPDLAIEIVSPSDRPGEIQARIRDLLEAGVRLIWFIYPQTHTVTVVRSLQERVELGSEDILDGEDVVRGFSCRVAELFE